MTVCGSHIVLVLGCYTFLEYNILALQKARAKWQLPWGSDLDRRLQMTSVVLFPCLIIHFVQTFAGVLSRVWHCGQKCYTTCHGGHSGLTYQLLYRNILGPIWSQARFCQLNPYVMDTQIFVGLFCQTKKRHQTMPLGVLSIISFVCPQTMLVFLAYCKLLFNSKHCKHYVVQIALRKEQSSIV